MHKAKLLKSFLIIASFIASTLVIGESIIEEVITTGSYLNSQTDESNQTLTVIDRDFIDKINAQNVNDIVKNDGVRSLLGRGLKTRILTNGLQGILFTITWKYFEKKLEE